ncbi:MAG TPA: phytanoyl-CoA dioxygenase family protein [Pseudonocardiaceae bacterium]|nr:phytanoyl-CoA dioxygenase family protein [Pseudonocardiaceae bacterium]
MLDQRQLSEFAERGYVMIPQAVPADLLAAATRTVNAIMVSKPPPDDVRGPHFYFPDAAKVPSLLALLTETIAWSCAESLTGAGTLQVPEQVQVALNIPPFSHRPGRPHIDGYPPLPDGRPGTFTMLAGVLLSDQPGEDGGNLWTWPGSHLLHARYFRENGPDAFFDAKGYPPVALPEPEQVSGRAGDVLLAHYLLGHNIGGNVSDTTRQCAYFRIKHRDHDSRWREFLQDPWIDYDVSATTEL